MIRLNKYHNILQFLEAWVRYWTEAQKGRLSVNNLAMQVNFDDCVSETNCLEGSQFWFLKCYWYIVQFSFFMQINHCIIFFNAKYQLQSLRRINFLCEGFLFRNDTAQGSKISIKSEHRGGNAALLSIIFHLYEYWMTLYSKFFLFYFHIIFCFIFFYSI